MFYLGKSVSLDEKTRIVVPEDRYGLYAIDVLDPDMVSHFVPPSYFFFSYLSACYEFKYGIS